MLLLIVRLTCRLGRAHQIFTESPKSPFFFQGECLSQVRMFKKVCHFHEFYEVSLLPDQGCLLYKHVLGVNQPCAPPLKLKGNVDVEPGFVSGKGPNDIDGAGEGKKDRWDVRLCPPFKSQALLIQLVEVLLCGLLLLCSSQLLFVDLLTTVLPSRKEKGGNPLVLAPHHSAITNSNLQVLLGPCLLRCLLVGTRTTCPHVLNPPPHVFSFPSPKNKPNNFEGNHYFSSRNLFPPGYHLWVVDRLLQGISNHFLESTLVLFSLNDEVEHSLCLCNKSPIWCSFNAGIDKVSLTLSLQTTPVRLHFWWKRAPLKFTQKWLQNRGETPTPPPPNCQIDPFLPTHDPPKPL